MRPARIKDVAYFTIIQQGGIDVSTRGFVGIGSADQFDGRYNQIDSYPTYLGPEVWVAVQRFLYNDRHLKGFAKKLLSFSDWRQFETDGRCKYCGQITGQPHSISGRLFALELEPIIENGRQISYPDPEAKYHQHDSLDSADNAIMPHKAHSQNAG